MELQSLIMGLLVAVLAFAVKTGLGWAYLWQRQGRGGRLLATLGVLGLYAFVFGLVLLLVTKVDLLSNYHLVEPLWRGGQTIHWLMAILLFIWGLVLMRSQSDQGDLGSQSKQRGQVVTVDQDGRVAQANKPPIVDQANIEPTSLTGAGREICCSPSSKRVASGSYGFLALIIPCPVCLSVVTMSLACLVIYFPAQALLGTGLLFLGFVLVATLAGVLVICRVLGRGENLERSLGLAMTTIASYFMISALVLPQFGQIDRVYRLAAYADQPGKALSWNGLWLLLVIVALASLGFFLERRKSTLE